MATSKLAMLNSACWATTTCVKIVAFTVTTTLSLVITSWRSPGRGISRMSTRWSDSTNGAMITRPGLVGLAVLAEALHDADLALLHDVDHLAQRQEHARTMTTRPSDDAGRRWLAPPRAMIMVRSSFDVDGRWPSTGHTISVVPSTARDQHRGAGRDRLTSAPLTASQRSPARRTWPARSGPPTRSSVTTSWPTRPPCTPGRSVAGSAVLLQGGAHPRPHEQDAERRRSTTAARTWSGDGVGERRRPRWRRRSSRRRRRGRRRRGGAARRRAAPLRRRSTQWPRDTFFLVSGYVADGSSGPPGRATVRAFRPGRRS